MKLSDTEQPRKCVRYGAIRTDDDDIALVIYNTASDVCSSCADDLKEEMENEIE